MARKKKSQRKARQGKPRSEKATSKQINSFADLHLSESYTSLVLGIIVVFVLGILVFVFAGHKRSTSNMMTPPVQKTNQTKSTTATNSATTYTVQDGQSLWDVAVAAYGDGYRWPDIAKANNLSSPDQISSGMVLKIPR